MSTLNRDTARQALLMHLWTGQPDRDIERLLDTLENCTQPFGWGNMLDLLRSTYPEWMIPQYSDADYGNGPQVVSLLRLVSDLRRQLEDR